MKHLFFVAVLIYAAAASHFFVIIAFGEVFCFLESKITVCTNFFQKVSKLYALSPWLLYLGV